MRDILQYIENHRLMNIQLLDQLNNCKYSETSMAFFTPTKEKIERECLTNSPFKVVPLPTAATNSLCTSRC